MTGPHNNVRAEMGLNPRLGQISLATPPPQPRVKGRVQLDQVQQACNNSLNDIILT